MKFFEYFAKKVVIVLKGDVVKVIFAMCILTFVASAFVNNISVILAVVPITIYLARGMTFNPIPVITAEVISSVIGGNMTPIGDFSNMLMASTAGLSFPDFLIVMGPICVLFLALFLWYIWFVDLRHRKKVRSAKVEQAYLNKVKEELHAMKMEWPDIKRVLAILGTVLVAFIVLPYFRIRLTPIALGGAFVLLAVENAKAKEVIKKISFTDVLFFIALFLIVGGALYSGLLKIISDGLITMAMGNKVLYPILLMFAMAFFTALLNSGPATAFITPIVMSSGFADFTDVVWWAVNLGSIAGAVACISGASAGIVSQTLAEEMVTDKSHGGLTFASYSRRGLPFAAIILIISSIYLAFLSMIP